VLRGLAGNLLAHVVEAEADVGRMSGSEGSDGHIALADSIVNSSMSDLHGRGGIAGDNWSGNGWQLGDNGLLVDDWGVHSRVAQDGGLGDQGSNSMDRLDQGSDSGM